MVCFVHLVSTFCVSIDCPASLPQQCREREREKGRERERDSERQSARGRERESERERERDRAHAEERERARERERESERGQVVGVCWALRAVCLLRERRIRDGGTDGRSESVFVLDADRRGDGSNDPEYS